MQDSPIKALREQLGLDQTEMADALGWGQSRLSNYENGIRTPPIEAARELAKFFRDRGLPEITVDDIYPKAAA